MTVELPDVMVIAASERGVAAIRLFSIDRVLAQAIRALSRSDGSAKRNDLTLGRLYHSPQLCEVWLLHCVVRPMSSK